jgi:hypothetical protein
VEEELEEADFGMIPCFYTCVYRTLMAFLRSLIVHPNSVRDP